jgi:hypothetical protein
MTDAQVTERQCPLYTDHDDPLGDGLGSPEGAGAMKPPRNKQDRPR